MIKTDFNKMKITFKYWITGKASSNSHYYTVLKAMELAEKYHCGKRKDGQHEFSHQLMICLYLSTLDLYFINPPLVYITALWHDLYEDYDCPQLREEMKVISEDGFNMAVRISKIRNGKKITYEQYFSEMSNCFICSIVKLADRISNISTMIGIFSFDKQTSYLKDLDDWFFPMLKLAKRTFPEQERAYENIKCILVSQQSTILATRNDLGY